MYCWKHGEQPGFVCHRCRVEEAEADRHREAERSAERRHSELIDAQKEAARSSDDDSWSSGSSQAEIGYRMERNRAVRASNDRQDQATAAMSERRWQDALGHCDAGLASSPGLALLAIKASAQREMGLLMEAEQTATQALATIPKDTKDSSLFTCAISWFQVHGLNGPPLDELRRRLGKFIGRVEGRDIPLV